MADCSTSSCVAARSSTAPARRGVAADVGIRDGRIVGRSRPRPTAGDDATRVVDADGLVVTPGFVDIHTHYDAQLLWDPMAARRRSTASPP